MARLRSTARGSHRRRAPATHVRAAHCSGRRPRSPPVPTTINDHRCPSRHRHRVLGRQDLHWSPGWPAGAIAVQVTRSWCPPSPGVQPVRFGRCRGRGACTPGHRFAAVPALPTATSRESAPSGCGTQSAPRVSRRPDWAWPGWSIPLVNPRWEFHDTTLSTMVDAAFRCWRSTSTGSRGEGVLALGARGHRDVAHRL